MITPVAISTIGYQYYIVFTIIGFCIPVSVYFLYPEVSIHNYIWRWLAISRPQANRRPVSLDYGASARRHRFNLP